MANNIAHFAIHADDVERAREFYSDVFGWQFNPYGPPNFYQIQTGPDGDPGVRGAVQARYDGDDQPIRGFECTIGVASVDETMEAVIRKGAKIVLEKCAIPQVGWLFKFEDSEGNLVVAMEYNSTAS